MVAIYSDRAHYDGKDHPRCKATPNKQDEQDRLELASGNWGCALPAGHGSFASLKLRPHSWIEVGE